MKNVAFVVSIFMLIAFEHARAGSSIVWLAVTGLVEQSDGVLAPVGDAVRLGTFDPDFNLQQLSSTSFNEYSKVQGNGWTEWDSKAIAMNIGMINGFFAHTFQPTDSTHQGQIYIWTFNDSDPNDASEWGIVTDPAWISPSNSPNSIVIDVGEAVDYIWGSASTNLGLEGGPNLRMAPPYFPQNEFLNWVPQMSNTALMIWATDPGVGYQIQQESGLMGIQNWVDFGSEMIAVSNQDSRVITLNTNENKSFYRVQRMEE